MSRRRPTGPPRPSTAELCELLDPTELLDLADPHWDTPPRGWAAHMSDERTAAMSSPATAAMHPRPAR